MEVLYNIGSMDIFKNLRILLLVIAVSMSIIALLKLKKIISNYNYINRKITMLENLKHLSEEEFISWIEEYLLKKGYCNFKYLEDEFYLVEKYEKEKLVFIDRKFNILDKVEAKYIHGYTILNSINEILVVTTSNIDNSFYQILIENKINYESFSKTDFQKGYKDFVVNELG
ncbi:hypothetical protein [uncultured Clostridium sp.]|uniref:hypothetical protein n=1 Tax=uncultured Clostridium sp. TaxID=59620 RepID=UPI002609D722|nr:hypothetical protein [uncultured Clostridium sp.]